MPLNTAFNLLALAAVFHSPSSLASVPDGILSNASVRAVKQHIIAVRSIAPCIVPYSRHGGAHRAADKPMGGKLVLPLEERRVSVEVGFRRHLDVAAPLPFPLDSRLRASALPDDVLCAIARSVELGDGLQSFRESALSRITAIANDVRPLSAQLNAALMPATVARISKLVNTVFMGIMVDALQ